MKISVLLVTLGLFLAACGPMNKKPPQDSQDKAKLSEASGVGGIVTSVKGLFYVKTLFPSAADGKTLQIGSNPCVVRFIHQNDLSGLSSHARLEGEYYHVVTSGNVRKHQLKVTQKSDGSFETDIAFKKKGDWLINFKIIDQDTSDEFVFQVSL